MQFSPNRPCPQVLGILNDVLTHPGSHLVPSSSLGVRAAGLTPSSCPPGPSHWDVLSALPSLGLSKPTDLPLLPLGFCLIVPPHLALIGFQAAFRANTSFPGRAMLPPRIRCPRWQPLDLQSVQSRPCHCQGHGSGSLLPMGPKGKVVISLTDLFFLSFFYSFSLPLSLPTSFLSLSPPESTTLPPSLLGYPHSY